MNGLYIYLICLTVILETGGYKENIIKIKTNILGPALTNRPFVIGWNVASEHCGQKFNVSLNLSDFDIVHNPDYSWQGSALTIFYHKQLGLFPWIDSDGTLVNGGLPQLVNLNDHLEKAAKDIESFIPDTDFQGPAVIDWEAWHPLFDRMTWGKFVVYRKISMDKVKAEHPDWSRDKIAEKAKLEYDGGAKTLMSFTLALGKIMRPKALWGYYLYPDCYNYNRHGKKHDRKCSSKSVHLNDEIQWLYDDSTALFPSAYIGEWLRHNKTVIDYVAYRVKEAMRVDHNRPGCVSIPVYMYHSLSYRKTTKLVELFDLRDSIGVAMLLGASGVTIWGDHTLANSKNKCLALNKYITSTLGPFVKATSDAASHCSTEYCSSHGRCAFSPISNNLIYDDEQIRNRVYLSVNAALEIVHQHLNKAAYKAFQFANMRYIISCQCYTGWHGKDCSFVGQ